MSWCTLFGVVIRGIMAIVSFHFLFQLAPHGQTGGMPSAAEVLDQQYAREEIWN